MRFLQIRCFSAKRNLFRIFNHKLPLFYRYCPKDEHLKCLNLKKNQAQSANNQKEPIKAKRDTETWVQNKGRKNPRKESSNSGNGVFRHDQTKKGAFKHDQTKEKGSPGKKAATVETPCLKTKLMEDKTPDKSIKGGKCVFKDDKAKWRRNRKIKELRIKTDHIKITILG